MASNPAEDDNIFQQLQERVDPKVIEDRQQAINERVLAIHQKSQNRLAELIDQNSTLPCAISSIHVLNAPNTRKGFLKRIFNPLLSVNQDRPYTLAEALNEVTLAASKLHRFDIFQEPISIFFDRPPQIDPSTTPEDISVFISVKEKSRLLLKTGTDLGNAEGSAYANLLLRNVFGGAETVSANASLGTRTRSAYQAFFDTPVLSNPDFRVEVGGLQSSTEKTWASHEEVLRGGWLKLKLLTDSKWRHEVSCNGVWRQITGLAANASPSVREDAGDSVKCSITHTMTQDRRDNPMLPSRGYLLKTINEVAGFGPLKGDVCFWKGEVETQAALPIPIPGIKGPSGITFATGLRAGLLHPLTMATDRNPKPSRINDRFQLGGPTDVRGFRLSGLGPRDGADAVGGDMYAAGSANLLFPLPRVGQERPLRVQAFLNGGRLLALRSKSIDGGMTAEDVQESVKRTMSQLRNELPSLAAGIGLVYAHPAARFELNFSLPLTLRKGEEGRKGLQLGVGISFL